MNAETLFQIANFWVIPGWILLWFFSYRRWMSTVVVYLTLSVLATGYTILIFSSELVISPEAFSTLAGIKSLFENDYLLVAGWIHYLAFDLAAGLLITRDSNQIGYPNWLRIVVLFFVFMLGPFGMLLYLISRIIFTKKLAWIQ